MRATDRAGADGARAPRAPPLLGEVIHVIATVCERPGMVAEPWRRLYLQDIAPSATSDGVWIEVGAVGLTYTIWVPLSMIAVAP